MAFYNNHSPYYTTDQSIGYMDVINFRDIPVQVDDILFQLSKNYEYRPDLLAFDLYGTSELWWVFSVRNKSIIKDPIYDMVSGTKIYLPKLSTLRATLGI
jgi:hypothetical protein